MNEVRLGKIEKVSFGRGGYQEEMIGISFTLSGGGYGVGDFWGEWGVERSERTEWTEEERLKGLGATCMRIRKLLDDAGVMSVEKLKGIPVEITFEGNILKSWRVLKEVL